MKLLDDWPRLVRRAWSVRLAILSAGLSAVEFALPFVAPERPSGWFAGAAVVVSLAAAAARIVAQPRSLP
ncbi:hypothetical protein GCM10007320_08460 [Pseudorhodoferax aquiterrae]|uniref:Sensor histidine kinase n=1 Tax=Pseudorhodoferax aquiterrae TaxID=747304 RepID=A0ABQ3FXV9_9BURK|nr:hypothetical protein [Pseudorhodoferax aquiterrae]GHC72527.1 hypothetical protein GCM10007320_08460 [Pseudorhodoferax aquiterrae]